MNYFLGEWIYISHLIKCFLFVGYFVTNYRYQKWNYPTGTIILNNPNISESFFKISAAHTVDDTSLGIIIPSDDFNDKKKLILLFPYSWVYKV